MVLGAAGSLHAFAVRGADFINPPSHAGRTDKRNRPHQRMRQQRIDGILSP